MLARYSQSLLPELYDIFGERLIDLIVIFGGKQIKIPSMDEINFMVRDADIFKVLSNGNFVAGLESLKKSLGIQQAEILERFDLVNKEMGFPVRKCLFCENVARNKFLTCENRGCKDKNAR